MNYAPKNVQEVWDNHFAAFCAQDMDKILLDYDESSVIVTYDQTDNKKEQYQGVEEARKLFENIFGAMVDLSDMVAPMIEVSEENNMAFMVWRNHASGFLDGAGTIIVNGDTKKIARHSEAFKTG